MFNFNWLFTIGLALSSVLVVAAPTPAGSNSEAVPAVQAAVPASPSEGQWKGTLELRPSYTTQSEEAHTEQAIELGYQFNPDRLAAYHFDFNINITDPKKPGQGLNPQPTYSYLRFAMNNLWKSGDWSLSYEPRLYLLTNQSDIDSKRYVSIRNYVTLANQVTSYYTLSLVEIPIFHIYGARGVGANPNKYFENRVYIYNDFTFGNLTVGLPILWLAPFNLAYGGSPATVAHNIFIWPEVAYAVDPNIKVGAALMTSSLVASDLSDVTLTGTDAGFSKSALQFFLRATL